MDDVKELEKEINQKVELLRDKFLEKLKEIKKTKSSKDALIYYMQNVPNILEKKYCEPYIDEGHLADYIVKDGWYDRRQVINYSSIIENIYDEFNNKYSTEDSRKKIIKYFLNKNLLSLKIDHLLGEKSVDEQFHDRIYSLLINRLKDNCFAFEYDW